MKKLSLLLVASVLAIAGTAFAGPLTINIINNTPYVLIGTRNTHYQMHAWGFPPSIGQNSTEQALATFKWLDETKTPSDDSGEAYYQVWCGKDKFDQIEFHATNPCVYDDCSGTKPQVYAYEKTPGQCVNITSNSQNIDHEWWAVNTGEIKVEPVQK